MDRGVIASWIGVWRLHERFVLVVKKWLLNDMLCNQPEYVRGSVAILRCALKSLRVIAKLDVLNWCNEPLVGNRLLGQLRLFIRN